MFLVQQTNEVDIHMFMFFTVMYEGKENSAV
jgi:hypothetical protein